MKRVNFIHIPKNGGMAVKKCSRLHGKIITTDNAGNLISPAYSKQLHDTMKQHGEHHGRGHARWRDFRRQLTSDNDSIAVVRNPWARTLSRYTFLMNSIKVGNAQKFRDYQPCSFSEFLEQRHKYGNLPFFWHRAIRGWYPQKDYVTDEQGNQRVDVLRTEHLNDDLTKYFGFNPQLERRNVSNVSKVDYRDVYTPEQIQIVADWYADDIDYFGFDFDTPATRHIWEGLE